MLTKKRLETVCSVAGPKDGDRHGVHCDSWPLLPGAAIEVLMAGVLVKTVVARTGWMFVGVEASHFWANSESLRPGAVAFWQHIAS